MMVVTSNLKCSWHCHSTSRKYSSNRMGGMPSCKSRNKLWHLPLNLERLKTPAFNSLAHSPRSKQSHPTSQSLTRRKTTKARVRARRDPSMFTLANGPGRTMLLHKGILRWRNSEAMLTFGVQPTRNGVLIVIRNVVNTFDSNWKEPRVETVVQTMPIQPTVWWSTYCSHVRHADEEWLLCSLCPFLLRFAASKMPIIIARTLWLSLLS